MGQREYHTEEQKQVGRCATVPLLALDLIKRVDNVISHCQLVVESYCQLFRMILAKTVDPEQTDAVH